jgi:hypothetical protein
MSAREARRRQWGPTKADREIEALSQLADEGFNPKTRQEAAIAINERAKANTAARGEMAYDQALGQMVPSAKERARQRAEENERDVQKLGLSAEDYWERNPESKRTAVNSRGETVDAMDLNRAYMQDRDAEQLQAGRRAGVVANYQANMAKERKANEATSRDRMDDFIIAKDQREQSQAKAEAYLKNFDRQARAMRRAAIGNSYAGKEGAEKFWDRNADVQSTAQNLRRMSKEDRLKWADSQVKADEEARSGQIKTASRPSAVSEDELAEFFNQPFSLTDFVKTFFGGSSK